MATKKKDENQSSVTANKQLYYGSSASGQSNVQNVNGQTVTKSNSSKAPNGVSQADWDKAHSSYTPSANVNNAYGTWQNDQSSARKILSQKDIIDPNTKAAMNKQFVPSQAYNQAMALTNSKLNELMSGKTKWTDKYDKAVNDYMNREDFSYDVDKDPLFQQALASAMNSGKSAMQDTIGQASALTGGYGSTYATSAGNQAYNAFIEDAYNNLPEYYQMALDAYQAEGQEMYNQVAMLGEADASEYNKIYTGWQASNENTNQIWNREFSVWDAETDNAFQSANVQLQEYGQRSQNAVNLANMSGDTYKTLYGQEFDKWNAEVDNLYEGINLQNTDYWNQTNFDEGVRQYEKSFAEDQRQFNMNYDQTEKWNQKDYEYKYDALAQDDKHFNMNYEQTEKWNEKDNQYRYDALAQDDKHFNMNYNQTEKWNQKDDDYRNAQLNLSEKEFNAQYVSDGKGGYVKKQTQTNTDDTQYVVKKDETGKEVTYKVPTSQQKIKALEEYNKGGAPKLNAYINAQDGYDGDAIAEYVAEYGDQGMKDYELHSNWTISKDTFNWWGGVDGNDVYTNPVTGQSMTYDNVKKLINQSSMSEKQKQEILEKLKNQDAK